MKHKATPRSDGHSDYVDCSCGWKGPGFWDGAHWAMDEWERHKRTASTTEDVLSICAERGLTNPQLVYRIALEEGGWLYCAADETGRRDWLVASD